MQTLNCILPSLVLLLTSSYFVSCEVYFVVPTQNSTCLDEPCLTLSQFANRSIDYIDQNITLIIAEGDHNLDREMSISNIAEFRILSVINTSSSLVNIICNDRVGVVVNNVSHISIRGMTFVGCGGTRFESVDELSIENSRFFGQGNRATLLTMLGCNAIFTKTYFLSNKAGSARLFSTCVGGALILSNSNVAINNCQFEENNAKIGGAIFSESRSNITITNSHFISNHATDCDDNELCLGGALFIDGTSTVAIHSSTFENNTSDQYGGGVAVVSQSNGALTLVATTFNNNRVKLDGGAVYLNRSCVTIRECEFSYNEADRNGGAIASNASSSVTPSSSRFISNSSTTDGGELNTINRATLIENSIFMNNTAQGSGGVIYAEYYSTVKLTEDCVLINNSATGSGGVMLAKMESSLLVEDCTFRDNVARFGAVILVTENSTCRINSSTFSGNQAMSRGGVICVEESGTSAVIDNSSFTQNNADSYGGVADVQNGGDLLVTDSSFDQNSANEGGVLDGYAMSHLKVYRSSFYKNMANMGGVIILGRGSTLITEESVYFCNNDIDIGAVIRAVDGNKIAIHDCKFINNSGNYGGVVAASNNNTVSIINSTFHGNRANTDGAVLYTRILGMATVYGSTFIDNIAINDGITLAADNSFMTLNYNTFEDNVAGHDGGVAYAYVNSTIAIDSCTLINNRADNSGGIAAVRNNCTVSVMSCLIDNNMAQSSGGGVFVQDRSRIFVEGSNFTNNTADVGGAIRIYVSSTANIMSSRFSENKARVAGGAMATYERSSIMAHACNFTSNTANVGGALIAFQNSIVLQDRGTGIDTEGMFRRNEINVYTSSFSYNRANTGGVMYIQGSNVTLENCSFDQNSARYDGGDIDAVSNSVINITTTNFTNNVVERNGGVIALIGNSITNMQHCVFIGNGALEEGGVLHLSQSNANIYNSTFLSSSANVRGGAFLITSNSLFKANKCVFMNNTASQRGGVFYAIMNSTLTVQHSSFINNSAVNNSGGALYVTESSKTCITNSKFQLNRARDRGGAIYTTVMAEAIISSSNFTRNMAEKGAALSARRSSAISFDTSCREIDNVNMANTPGDSGAIQIRNNTATSGGGIYLNEANLQFGMDTVISYNQAKASGGGIHAVSSSSITFKSMVNIVSNKAVVGGGISLENSKLYNDKLTLSNVSFVSNQACRGGALHVDDKSEESVCYNDPYTGEYSSTGGCFFQNVTKGLMINFDKNIAESSGEILFGGLIDRCGVVSDTNLSRSQPGGIVRLKEISNIVNFNAVSSEPVRLCPCKSDNEPDCNQQAYHIQVKNKDTFSIPIAAVDQVNHTVAATVQSTLRDLNLSESQRSHRIDTTCSNLEYRVFFPNVSKTYELILYPDGPCGDKGKSKFSVNIFVSDCTCPPGFMTADTDTDCACVCDTRYELFSRHIQECNATTETVVRKGQFWITYLNDSDDEDSMISPYFIYPFCPLDYCQPPSRSIPINLNLANGSDAQCANNRGGILCGNCQTDYSLSLGSSKCIICTNRWHGPLEIILIASVFAGVILVVSLLVLNLTVAVGTLNSIIFYANIINVNRSVYFNQPHLTFVPVFISWLNLDIGFDTCFYEGMDTYTKTWLQLAFPLYIILLVVVIIWVSSCSSRFSNLIGKKNPVATLATLILLSYNKLLQIVITSFSFVNLKYPNGTQARHWLPDASIEYSEGKLIILVCVASLILILGLVYTILIFSWQWLIKFSRLRLFVWTRNQKLHTFIDTYHNPYTAKHRYWTGLLLLVRVIVYLVYAFSVSVDPRITLLFTVVIMCSLIMYKTMWIVKVHKNRLLNAMESFVLFNIATFAVITLYTFNDLGNDNIETLQTVAAYISVGMVLLLCLMVILFHVYRYSNAKIHLFVKNTKLGQQLSDKISHDLTQEECTPLESKLFDVLDHPRSAHVHAHLNGQLYGKPTTSDVSLTNCDVSALTANDKVGKEDESKLRTKSEAPRFRSIIGTKFDLTRKSEPPISLSSFAVKEKSNDSLTRPLLEEEELKL